MKECSIVPSQCYCFSSSHTYMRWSSGDFPWVLLRWSLTACLLAKVRLQSLHWYTDPLLSSSSGEGDGDSVEGRGVVKDEGREIGKEEDKDVGREEGSGWLDGWRLESSFSDSPLVWRCWWCWCVIWLSSCSPESLARSRRRKPKWDSKWLT